MPKTLSEDQIDQYARDGYIAPLRILSQDDTAAFGRRVAEVEAAGGLQGADQTKFYLRYPWVHALATDPRLLDMVEDLIGPDIMLYHNTAWFKEGSDGAYVSWHQDNTYFGHDPCEVLTAWFAITPSTEMSGCMRFLPGTHKLGQLPLMAPEIDGGNMLTSGQTVEFDAATVDPVPIVLQPGEISIHHAFLIHGSLPNRAGARRMGMTFIYHAPHLDQIGDCRNSALLVRGEDRFGKFLHERPPVAADDPDTIAHHEQSVARYREKIRELGNRTATRLD